MHGREREMRGLTLLEVLVALAILSIALIALSRAQSQSLFVAGESRLTTTLSLLAQAKMAEMEAMDPLENLSNSGAFDKDYPEYEWQVKVTDAESRAMKKIEVLVRAKRSAGRNGLTLTLYRYASEDRRRIPENHDASSRR